MKEHINSGIDQQDVAREVVFAGYPCLELRNTHGVVTVSLHGGQVLSWVPAGQRDVFWLSPQALPPPGAVRGGVPICWPWFSKQAMPEGGMQHGPVRNMRWRATAVQLLRAGDVQLQLEPDASLPDAAAVLARFAPHLQVRLTITLGATLDMALQTDNHGPEPFALTQALHSYFAVGQVQQVHLQGVQGLRFDSRLDGSTANLQDQPFAMHTGCDNTYARAATPDALASPRSYTLQDPVWQRQLSIQTQGSQSLVVWNPGSAGAAKMADVPDAAWTDFLCIEAANAASDTVTLAPGAQHTLRQTLQCSAWSL